jgi:hypothetical protein
MKNTILNTDTRIFLVSFLHKTTDNKFMFSTANDLMHILKTHDKTGIDYIKEFNPVKNSFIRVSKADFLRFANYETEASIYFESHYYFKK